MCAIFAENRPLGVVSCVTVLHTAGHYPRRLGLRVQIHHTMIGFLLAQSWHWAWRHLATRRDAYGRCAGISSTPVSASRAWRRSPLVWIRHGPRLPMEPQFASHVTWTPTTSFSSVIGARPERRSRSPRSAELLQPEGAYTPLAVEVARALLTTTKGRGKGVYWGDGVDAGDVGR
jgi:hypothetical protein